MNTPLDIYRLNRPVGGKLKLRAMSLQAMGDEESRIDAAVLLREAARTERRCIALLPHASGETRLAAAIEECGCLLEAGDPPGAAEVWRRVLRERTAVAPDVATAMSSRLEPRYQAEMTRFQTALRAAPIFLRRRQDKYLLPPSGRERSQLESELHKLTGLFPGMSGLWWARYRLADAAEKTEDAWRMLDIAWRLEPEEPSYEAIRLDLALRRSPDQAAKILEMSYSNIDHAPAERCLVHALAEIRLAHTPTSERWLRAQTAASEGIKRATSEGLRRWLMAVELLVLCELQGLRPTHEILYTVGLNHIAANAEAEGSLNVIDVIRAEAASQIFWPQARAA